MSCAIGHRGRPCQSKGGMGEPPWGLLARAWGYMVGTSGPARSMEWWPNPSPPTEDPLVSVHQAGTLDLAPDSQGQGTWAAPGYTAALWSHCGKPPRPACNPGSTFSRPTWSSTVCVCVEVGGSPWR